MCNCGVMVAKSQDLLPSLLLVTPVSHSIALPACLILY
jgi:hypothetical protein